MHHAYKTPFSWAGGWVHPLEDLLVVACQIITPVYILDVCQDISQRIFTPIRHTLLFFGFLYGFGWPF